MKTNELKALIKSLLDRTEGMTYYRKASKDAMYPHKVFTFNNVDLGDISRDDIILAIDVWTKDANQADDMADRIESAFNNINYPYENILPTFYRVGRRPVDDEDKSIERRQIKIQVQLYERGA